MGVLTMDEYISRKKAKRLLHIEYAYAAEQLLDEISAADVAPVVHGLWDGNECTVCKLPWNYNMVQDADDWGDFDPMPDYCPNCGAKMDGGNS